MKERFEKAKKKVVEFKNKASNQVKDKANRFGKWASDNKEIVVGAGVPMVMYLVRSSQSMLVNRRIKSERKRIDTTYYDPSTGIHWDLRRKMTNAEKEEFLRRKKGGESVPDILRKMKLNRWR